MSTPFSDFAQRYLYKDHQLDNEYTVMTGKVIVPIAEAEPTDPVELATWKPYTTVRVHAPIVTRRVPFQTAKEGSPPKIPAPANTSIYEFLEGTIAINGPQSAADGLASTWRISGDYQYVVGCAASLVLNQGFVLGTLPMPTPTQQLLSTGSYDASLTSGPVGNADTAVKVAYAAAQTINFSSSAYAYFYTNFLPAVFLTDNLLNGTNLAPTIP